MRNAYTDDASDFCINTATVSYSISVDKQIFKRAVFKRRVPQRAYTYRNIL